MTLAQHLEIYESLRRNKVKYLVIGGIASISYGVPRNTLDLDIWIEPNVKNVGRLLNAFKKVKLGTAHLITPNEILKNEIVIFDDYLKVDVLTTVKGLQDFKTAWDKRVVRKISRVRINYIALSDLIKSKSATKRPIDREDLKALCLIARKKRK